MSNQVVVTLTDKEFADVESKAKEVGLTVAQYVKRYAITDDDFEVRYDFLKREAANQPCGVPFTVMSLFQDEWHDISRGVKLSLGRCFYHLVKAGKLDSVKTAGKNSSSIQQYIVVKERN